MQRLLYITFFVLLCVPTISSAQLLSNPTQQTNSQTLSNEVDIVIEADTLAPAFYNGRHEPSPGSVVRVIALVDGVNRSDYTYRFEIGGDVVEPQDSNITTFTAPETDHVLVEVDVFDENGTRVAANQRYITISEPNVVFYTTSLLQGVSENAIADTHTLTGEELSVRAEPYFMDSDILSNNYQLSWQVDSRTVQGSSENEQVITLKNTEPDRTPTIQFSLRNARALTQYVDGQFEIQL